MMPLAFGYVSVIADGHTDEARVTVTEATCLLGDLGSREGYRLVEVFTDVRGRTETGLYRMLEALRRGDAVAVVTPDLDHLSHAGCLTGADLHNAARYLQTRLLTLTSRVRADRDAPRGHRL